MTPVMMIGHVGCCFHRDWSFAIYIADCSWHDNAAIKRCPAQKQKKKGLLLAYVLHVVAL